MLKMDHIQGTLKTTKSNNTFKFHYHPTFCLNRLFCSIKRYFLTSTLLCHFWETFTGSFNLTSMNWMVVMFFCIVYLFSIFLHFTSPSPSYGYYIILIISLSNISLICPRYLLERLGGFGIRKLILRYCHFFNADYYFYFSFCKYV